MEDVKSMLPICSLREDILRAVQDHQVLLFAGSSYSAVTTQLPQYLYQDGRYTQSGKLIGCVQPSSFMAKSVESRVSKEMMMMGQGQGQGQVVGSSIRFMTADMLLHEILAQPNLFNYSVIMVDQPHERTLSTDLLLALLKPLVLVRPDLKLLINMSPSSDVPNLSIYFDHAPIFVVPRTAAPVEILYAKEATLDYLEFVIWTVFRIHVTEPDLPSDILVYLPGGQEEIESVKEEILLRYMKMNRGKEIETELIICPIYDYEYEYEYNSKVFEFEKPTPPGARKVYLATNDAMASLVTGTINGMNTCIKYVIDSGLCKHMLFDPLTGTESYKVLPISKELAKQRIMQCGGGPGGKCYRLYTQDHYFEEMEDNTLPEIQRKNLVNAVLILKSLGIDDLFSFDFMDQPPVQSLSKALEISYALGALDRQGELTPLGRRMAEFFALDDPILSKMIVVSENYNCSEEMITVAAMLSSTRGDSVFYCPKDREVQANSAKMRFHEGNVGDPIAMLMVYNEWRSSNYESTWCHNNFVEVRSMNKARDIRDQLEGILKRVGIELKSNLNDLEAIKKAIISGSSFNLL